MRFKKAIRRRAQFLSAVVIAAVYGISRFTWPEIWFAVKSVWGAVWANKKGDVSHAKWVHRMKCCMRCPIWAAKYKTCGSPFSTEPQLGCYCYEPLAAKQSAKGCWLDENSNGTLEHGWKE